MIHVMTMIDQFPTLSNTISLKTLWLVLLMKQEMLTCHMFLVSFPIFVGNRGVWALVLLFVCFTFMFEHLLLFFCCYKLYLKIFTDLAMLISSEQQYSFLFIILVKNITVEIYKRSKKSPEIPESIFQTMF
jgi:hypothetical protein